MQLLKVLYTLTILILALPLQAEKAPVKKVTKLPLPTYSAHPFNLREKLINLSDKQLLEHNSLYKGYVDKRNQIAQSLETVDRSSANNRSYAPYRSLKLAETFAMNGDILHRLYFQNMASTPTKMGSLTHDLIIESFGSIEQFKRDLVDAGLVANGWVLTAYSLDDHRLHNYVLESHNNAVPVMVIPILVLDVYEHAYWMDYGTKRAEYISTFWNNIDWEVVEERIIEWVQPLSAINFNIDLATLKKNRLARKN